MNKTGVEIHKVYISPHDKDDWEEDILGKDTLPNGETVDIKFHRSETAETTHASHLRRTLPDLPWPFSRLPRTATDIESPHTSARKSTAPL